MKTKKLQDNESNKDSKIILLAGLVLLIAIISFNFTGMTGAVVDYEGISRWLIGNINISNFDISLATVYIVYFIVLVMLAAAFSDILVLATPFSEPIAWILGIGLALIAALTGLVRIFAQIAFSLIAMWGTFTVVAVLAIAFLFFLVGSPIIARLKMQRKINALQARGRIQGAEIKSLSDMAKQALGIAKTNIPWYWILAFIVILIIVAFITINLI